MNIIKYLSDWRYRYFSKKLNGVRSMILDLEFKRFKTREIREEVRQTFDQNKAKILSLNMRIEQERGKDKNDKSKMADGDIARLDDEIVRLKKDNDRYTEQMKSMDIEVEGSRETNELPNGYSGISQQLDSLHELDGMIQDYRKGL